MSNSTRADRETNLGGTPEPVRPKRKCEIPNQPEGRAKEKPAMMPNMRRDEGRGADRNREETPGIEVS
ncbi:hypothetical protein CR513_48872, partial [Mucuna pruriens]